ncbi:hypothetical protein [Saccharopolyspora hirsuta]|nr:hypothetical protein [Saccharopolyspora hirsuta]
MTQQGDAFNKVQSSIPGKDEEQEVPDNNWFEDTWDSMVNGQTDAEAAKQHNEKLRQEAVQAFETYANTSQSNVASSAVFTPPPENGMKVAVSGSQHPTVGGVPTVSNTPSGTSSQWAGGGGTGGVGGGGSSTVPSGYSGGSGGFGSGGTGGGGGGYGTTPVWQRPGQGGPGQSGPGGGRVPTGPGAGQPGVPGMALGPGGGSGTGAGAGGRVPGAGGAGGRGFGAGGAGGAGGRGAGSGLGAGGRAGAGGLGGAGGTGTGSGAGGAGGAGGRGGMAGAGAAAGRPQGKQGEEDQEHETPEFLKGDHGFFDDDMPKVAPPVFGDWDQQK